MARDLWRNHSIIINLYRSIRFRSCISYQGNVSACILMTVLTDRACNKIKSVESRRCVFMAFLAACVPMPQHLRRDNVKRISSRVCDRAA